MNKRKSKPKQISTNIFKALSKDTGLPGKSYLWILTIDYHVKLLLSMICKKPAFEMYITSLLRRFYRSKDRTSETIKYLNFLATNDESRIYFIYPSKTFSRQAAIKFISLLHKDILQVKSLALRLSNNETLTQEEVIFYTEFVNAWGFDKRLMEQVKSSLEEIQEIISVLYTNMKSYIIKMLMARRKSEATPENLYTDAYEVIMTMIDQYNLRRKDDDPNITKKGKGKVPFTRQLDWLVKSKKNLIIQDENLGLGLTTPLISLSTYLDEDNNSAVMFHNNIMSSVENSLKEEKETPNIKNSLVELGFECLTKPFRQLVTVNYKLLNPLSVEEQIEMLLDYNNFKTH